MLIYLVIILLIRVLSCGCALNWHQGTWDRVNSPQYAVCLYGMFIRRWPTKHLSHLFDLNRTDFFVYTSDRLLWNLTINSNEKVTKSKTCSVLYGLGVQMDRCYAETIAYNDHLFDIYTHIIGEEFKPNVVRKASMFFSISQCMEMVRIREQSRAHNFTYDGIILTRADVIDYVDYHSSFDKESIVKENIKNHSVAWVGASKTRKLEDRFMIGTRHAMIHFRNLLGRYPELVRLTVPGLEVYHKNKPHDTSYIVPEWLIYEFLHQLHGVEIKQRVSQIRQIPPLDSAEKLH